MEVKPLTHLIKPSALGSVHGRCIFCYQLTDHGFDVREIPDTFVDYDKAQRSDVNVICEHCYTFLTSPAFRRRSWIIYGGDVHFISSRKDVLKHLESPPEPPYAIYIVKQGKKHGWLNMMFRGVNYSRDVITVGFEDELVTIVRDEFLRLVSFLMDVLRSCRKSDVMHPSPSLALRIGHERLRELMDWKERREQWVELALALL